MDASIARQAPSLVPASEKQDVLSPTCVDQILAEDTPRRSIPRTNGSGSAISRSSPASQGENFRKNRPRRFFSVAGGEVTKDNSSNRPGAGQDQLAVGWHGLLPPAENGRVGRWTWDFDLTYGVVHVAHTLELDLAADVLTPQPFFSLRTVTYAGDMSRRPVVLSTMTPRRAGALDGVYSPRPGSHRAACEVVELRVSDALIDDLTEQLLVLLFVSTSCVPAGRWPRPGLAILRL